MADGFVPDAKELTSESSVPADPAAPADPEPAAELPARLFLSCRSAMDHRRAREALAAPGQAAFIVRGVRYSLVVARCAFHVRPVGLLGSETAREPEPAAPFKPVAQSSSVPEPIWEDANSWSDEFVPLTAPRVAPTAVKEVAPAPPKETIEKLQWSAAGQAVPSIAEKNAQFTVPEKRPPLPRTRWYGSALPKLLRFLLRNPSPSTTRLQWLLPRKFRSLLNRKPRSPLRQGPRSLLKKWPRQP